MNFCAPYQHIEKTFCTWKKCQEYHRLAYPIVCTNLSMHGNIDWECKTRIHYLSKRDFACHSWCRRMDIPISVESFPLKSSWQPKKNLTNFSRLSVLRINIFRNHRAVATGYPQKWHRTHKYGELWVCHLWHITLELARICTMCMSNRSTNNDWLSPEIIEPLKWDLIVVLDWFLRTKIVADGISLSLSLSLLREFSRDFVCLAITDHGTFWCMGYGHEEKTYDELFIKVLL